ncbi:MAG TPA: hypothetical protein DCS67_06080 [Clostridiales bacterium UBA8960]|jgi:REP element-mobilizing transposase RayT|nr:hypothetical protein [Clostridiales bacterium UBA8960]
MSRKLREYHKHGIYHIIQRGNNKTFIFEDQADKQYFVDLIKEVHALLPFYMLYYVLMDNHYHLLIEMLDHEIGPIMKLINMCYSKYYNKKYGRVGTIFGGRYSALEVKDARYFVRLISYIANNPVKAGIVKKPSDYKWGAHHEVVTKEVCLMNKAQLFEKLDLDPRRAYEIYNEALSEGVVDYRHLDTTTHEFSELERKKRREEAIKSAAFAHFDYSKTRLEVLLSEKRTPERTTSRKSCAIYLHSQGYSVAEIAAFFGVSSRAARYMVVPQ